MVEFVLRRASTMASWYWSFSLQEETESGVAKKGQLALREATPEYRDRWSSSRRIEYRERGLEAGQALSTGVSERTAGSRKSPEEAGLE